MSSLWGTTKTAVNSGYGMSGFARIGLPNPFYKPRPWGIPGIHPELLEHPPYAQKEVAHKMSTRGGSSLVKGSKEAKARMAYLRSLRGKTRGGKYALRGGDMSWVKPLLESLGGTAMNAIKKLALETGASLTELMADPKSLIQNLMNFAPAAARAVKNFFTGKKDNPISSATSKRREYLRMLKKYDPDLYERKRRQALMRKREQERKRYEAMKRKYGDYDDDEDDYDNTKYNYADNNDDDDDVDNDEYYTQKIKPKPKSSNENVIRF